LRLLRHPLFCTPLFPPGPLTRRAGWVACNILLDKIPVNARIPVVNEGTPVTSQEVRASYNRLRPLEKLQVEKRGWALDVLQVVQSLGKLEFTLADVYAQAGDLAKLHPNNAHVRDKIRQQLQVLRDLGLLTFLGSGEYRLT
jgi:type II restriction enzyme